MARDLNMSTRVHRGCAQLRPMALVKAVHVKSLCAFSSRNRFARMYAASKGMLLVLSLTRTSLLSCAVDDLSFGICVGQNSYRCQRLARLKAFFLRLSRQFVASGPWDARHLHRILPGLIVPDATLHCGISDQCFPSRIAGESNERFFDGGNTSKETRDTSLEKNIDKVAEFAKEKTDEIVSASEAQASNFVSSSIDAASRTSTSPDSVSSSNVVSAKSPTRLDTEDGMKLKIQDNQRRLLSTIASLDRGLVATSQDLIAVDSIVRELEGASGPLIFVSGFQEVPDGSMTNYVPVSMLVGRWRLVYSSGLASGSLGGRRPGPPSSLVPFTLGQVYQDINVYEKTLDNVVELFSRVSVKYLPGLETVQAPTLTARLKHKFEVLGGSTLQITFENTTVRFSGGLGGWLDNVPDAELPELPEALKSLTEISRRASFDVVFLDFTMRVTRGDRGELRIFVKE